MSTCLTQVIIVVQTLESMIPLNDRLAGLLRLLMDGRGIHSTIDIQLELYNFKLWRAVPSQLNTFFFIFKYEISFFQFLHYYSYCLFRTKIEFP